MFKKVGRPFGYLLGRIFGCPMALKRYLWYTDLILSTLGAYLGDFLGDKCNLIELPPQTLLAY